MTPEQIRQLVLNALTEVAPEADLQNLRPNVSFRDQLDIDSMDYLNFMIALSKSLNIDIPERDYPKLGTVDSCVDYLSRKRVRAM